MMRMKTKNPLLDQTGSTDKSAQAEEPIHTVEDVEEPAHQEFNTGYTEDQPIDETTQFSNWFQKPAKPPTPDRDWNKTLPAAHGPIQPWISNLAWKEDPHESFNELIDNPLDFSTFVLNRLKGRKRQQLYGFAVNKESARDVYSRHRILVVTKLKIVEWNNYKNLEWITIRRNDDKLYTFKEGDYNRLHLQDIEDMLLLLKGCGRSSIRCQKLPKEAQPHKAGYVQIRSQTDGTLNDVRSALDDILKRIRMKYLPQTV
ncbi:hypothetical protein Tco_1085429 [Tanacetum coccineum]